MTELDGHRLQLSKGNVKRIMRSQTDRVSDDAALQVAHEEQDRIKRVTRLAIALAEHAGRKTVQEEDIRMVYMMEDEL